MAKVTINPAQFAHPIDPPLKTPATYTLELSAKEIAALWATLQLVGGTGIRYHVTGIVDAIHGLVPEIRREAWSHEHDTRGVRDLTNNSSIFFNQHSDDTHKFKAMVRAAERKQ